jgi:hypothetical protein
MNNRRKSRIPARLRACAIGLFAAALLPVQSATASSNCRDRAEVEGFEQVSAAGMNHYISRQSQACVNRFICEFSDLKLNDVPLDKIDWKDACISNHNDGKLTNHNKIPGNPSRATKIGSQQVRVDRKLGSCEATLEAVKLSYLTLRNERIRTCGSVYQELNRQAACVRHPDRQDCLPHLQQMIDRYKDGNDTLMAAAANAAEFVNRFPKLNEQALTRYRADLAKLREHFSAERQPASMGPASLLRAHSELPPVDPANGGAPNVEEYFRLLQGDAAAAPGQQGLSSTFRARSGEPRPSSNEGPLPVEQENARALASSFAEKLRKFRSEDSRAFGERLGKFNAALKNRKDKTTPGAGNEWVQGAGAVGGLAGPLINRGGAGAPPPAAAAVATGLSGSPIPALGAAALAGAAVGSAASRSQAGGPMTPPAPGTPAQNPNTTNLFEAAGAPDLPAQFNAESPATGAEGSGAEEGIGGNFVPPSAPPMASGGASFQGEGSTRSSKQDVSVAPSEAGAGDDMLTAFSGDLKPAPGPKKADAMGDVTSLLGQMKNLFNFEDDLGMGAAGGPLFSSQAPPPPGGRDPAGSWGPGGTGENYSEDYPYEDESLVQASGAIGERNISLFRRIHDRHRSCQERGLVLNGIGGIPE